MKSPGPSLPKIRGYKPESLELKPHPRWRCAPQTLMRSIDLELRQRMDGDNERTRMFSKLAPGRVVPGTALLVESVSSRSDPKKSYVAGIVTGIFRSGITSRVKLGCRAMGVPYTASFPIYSPMVTRFLVLHAPKLPQVDVDPQYAENPHLIGMDYDTIETMLSKHKMNQLKSHK